jgi:hypothetical protein
LVDHLDHAVGFGPAKSGFHKLVKAFDDVGRVIASIDRTSYHLEQWLLHALHDLHFSSDQQSGDVLGGIGDVVLKIENLEQITPIDLGAMSRCCAVGCAGSIGFDVTSRLNWTFGASSRCPMELFACLSKLTRFC